MNEKKIRRGLYVSFFGVTISIILVIFQLMSRQPVWSGLLILGSNSVILMSNYTRLKKFREDNE